MSIVVVVGSVFDEYPNHRMEREKGCHQHPGLGGNRMNLSGAFGLQFLGSTVTTFMFICSGNMLFEKETLFSNRSLQLQVKIVVVSIVLTIVLSFIMLQCDNLYWLSP